MRWTHRKPSETKIVKMEDVPEVSSPASSSLSTNARISNRSVASETNPTFTRKDKTEYKVRSRKQRRKKEYVNIKKEDEEADPSTPVNDSSRKEAEPKWQMFVTQEPSSGKLEEMGWQIVSSTRPTGAIDKYYFSPKNAIQFRSLKQATIFMPIVEFFNGSEDKALLYYKKNELIFKSNCTEKKHFNRNGEQQNVTSRRSRTARHQVTNQSKMDKARKRNEIEVGASSNKKQRRASDRVLSQVKQVGSRVYARYTNKMWYWGKITKIANKNGAPRYEVKFDDEDVLDDIKDAHLVLEHEFCAKQESATPSNWRQLVETEPPDEKLNQWGWTRISSGLKKGTGLNDGYWYLSPKTQKKFRSKKKAKMFGLIVEYFNGSEEDAYEYVLQNDAFFNSFVWRNPLKKESKVKNPIDEQVAEACMDSTNDNKESDKPNMGSPTERYLFALRWTEEHRLGENGSIKICWSPPKSSKEFDSVAMAVKYLDLLKETDGDEEAAFKRLHKDE